MACYLPSSLFFILPFVVVVLCCALCVAGNGAGGSGEEKKNIEVFKLEKMKENVQKPASDGSNIEGIEFTKVNSPLFLVAKNNVIVALAEANYTKTTLRDGEKVSVLARHFNAKDVDSVTKIFNEDDPNWKTQLVVENSDGKISSKIRSFLVNADGDKICIFLVNVKEDTGKDWEFKLVEGTVNEGTGFKWETSDLKGPNGGEAFKKTLQDYKMKSFAADGSAFFIKDKKFLFVVKGESEKGGSEKYVTAVFHFEKRKDLELVDHGTSKDFYSTFFQWEEKIFKIPTNSGSENVMEFNTSQKFTKSSNSIFRLCDFLKNKNKFSTAAFQGGKSVLLFTQEKSSGSGGDKKDAHLWMTDGTRVVYVGPIITGFKDISYGPLLHTKKNLFVLHQNYDTESGDKKVNEFNITLLDGQLNNINNIMTTWENNKETVSKLCKNIDKQKISCTKAPPTNGLVGFLHSTTNGNTNNVIWKDEYCFSSVTVVKGEAENATIGLKFSGAGKRAEWPMKNQQEEKPYNFIDFGFTLVATVTIGNDTNNVKNSILGIKLKPDTKSVGLWCTTDGKWGVSDGSDTALKISEKECKQGNTYNVALVSEAQNLNIYVNGEKLTFSTSGIKKFESSESIEQFYFGAKSRDAESHVTVTNVLLYNRPFNQGEIENLKNYIKSVEVIKTPPQNVDTNTTPQGDEQQPPPIPTSTKGKGEDEKSPSPSRTEDGGVGGGVRVFSLLLAVLCVSAPLLHL